MKHSGMTRRGLWSLTGGLVAVMAGIWSVAAGAQDIELYIVDTHTGDVEQASFTPDSDEYNGSFCNNGKMIVHDYLPHATFTHELAITNLKTGETTPLGLEGDNAVWSPNGQYIAYGFWFDFEAPPKIVVIPAEGGDPVFEREWALDPSWSNDSKRLAFTELWVGYIGTTDMEGNETYLDVAGAWGCNPDYSNDGKLIVFENWECFYGEPAPLMIVPVNQHGEAIGDAYPITSGEYYAAHPSFSNDGKSIVFSGDPDGDWDFGLYTVSVYGGDPVLLHDGVGTGEWDAAYSNNGRHVVFSSDRPVTP